MKSSEHINIAPNDPKKESKRKLSCPFCCEFKVFIKKQEMGTITSRWCFCKNQELFYRNQNSLKCWEDRYT